MAGIRAGEQECMDVLIERYKGQVRKEARTLYLIGGDSDDLIQEGILGLFKAIRDYRPGAGGFLWLLCEALYLPADLYRHPGGVPAEAQPIKYLCGADRRAGRRFGQP